MAVTRIFYSISLRRGFCDLKLTSIPYGLVARISGFHPEGPGSIPGMGGSILFCKLSDRWYLRRVAICSNVFEIRFGSDLPRYGKVHFNYLETLLSNNSKLLP